MPGPIGECCKECYWWDLDRKKSHKEDNMKGIYMFYADCCYGNPGSKYEICTMREDLWCSEFINREYGINNYKEDIDEEDE